MAPNLRTMRHAEVWKRFRLMSTFFHSCDSFVLAQDFFHFPAGGATVDATLRPVVSTVNIGANRVEQLRVNVLATEIALDDQDMSDLDAVSRLPIEIRAGS